MKKISIVAIILCACFSLCFSGCGGTDYEDAVKEAFISDASLNGYAMRMSLEDEVGETVSFDPVKKSAVQVTVVTEGEEYIAEGDVTFKSLNAGSGTVHYVGTYTIEDGEVINTDWDME